MKKVFFSTVLMLLLSGFGYANNLPPLASFSNDVNRAFFFSGETITFDGSGSIDQDESGSSITYYRWRVDGVIVYQGSSASQFTTSFSLTSGQNSKTVEVRLEVRDDEYTWTTFETRMSKTYTIRRGQDRQFYVKDHLGSVRVTVDEEGEPLGYDDYYPFGLQMPTRSSNTSNPNDAYKYTGHERDTEAGLTFDYMGARTYDPLLGTFQQIDPLLEFASPYSYVGGNPVNSTDPTGMSSCSENGATGFVSAEFDNACDQEAANNKKKDKDEKTIEKEKDKKEQVTGYNTENGIRIDNRFFTSENLGDYSALHRGKLVDFLKKNGDKIKKLFGDGGVLEAVSFTIVFSETVNENLLSSTRKNVAGLASWGNKSTKVEDLYVSKREIKPEFEIDDLQIVLNINPNRKGVSSNTPVHEFAHGLLIAANVLFREPVMKGGYSDSRNPNEQHGVINNSNLDDLVTLYLDALSTVKN